MASVARGVRPRVVVPTGRGRSFGRPVAVTRRKVCRRLAPSNISEKRANHVTSVPPRPENSWPSDQPQAPGRSPMMQTRPPFSKAAVAGFVLGCVGLIVFAFIGPLATVISRVGLNQIRKHGLRGRGLAIAGMILGVADFVFYLIAHYVIHP